VFCCSVDVFAQLIWRGGAECFVVPSMFLLGLFDAEARRRGVFCCSVDVFAWLIWRGDAKQVLSPD